VISLKPLLTGAAEHVMAAVRAKTTHRFHGRGELIKAMNQPSSKLQMQWTRARFLEEAKGTSLATEFEVSS
jgi:hypothetical protein